MRQHWNINPLPPPDDSKDSPDGFTSLALLVFVIVGPLIYFGPELRAMEAWVVRAFQTIEAWILPARDWLIG